MKKTKIISILVAALVFVFVLLNPFGGEGMNDKDMVNAVLVKEKINEQVIIKEDMIYEKKIHKGSVPAGLITKKSDILGKVALVPMYKDEVLTVNKVEGSENEKLGLAYRVKKGKRGVSIAVTKSQGISGLLKVGNRVDIIGHVGVTGGKGGHEASLVVADAKVLAIGKNVSDTGEVKDEGVYDTVTFEVSPEDAVKLSLLDGKNNNTAHLILRNQEDGNSINIKLITQGDLKK